MNKPTSSATPSKGVAAHQFASLEDLLAYLEVNKETDFRYSLYCSDGDLEIAENAHSDSMLQLYNAQQKGRLRIPIRPLSRKIIRDCVLNHKRKSARRGSVVSIESYMEPAFPDFSDYLLSDCITSLLTRVSKEVRRAAIIYLEISEGHQDLPIDSISENDLAAKLYHERYGVQKTAMALYRNWCRFKAEACALLDTTNEDTSHGTTRSKPADTHARTNRRAAQG